MPIPERVHNKVKEWIQENGPIKCEGEKQTALLNDIKIAFEQENYPLPNNPNKCLHNLLQKHRGVIIKGDRKGELPGLHPDKVKERNASEKQKECKRKWNHSDHGKAIKHKHNTGRLHSEWWHKNMVQPKIDITKKVVEENQIPEAVLEDDEAASIVQEIMNEKKTLFEYLENSDAAVYFYYTAEPVVDPALKSYGDGNFNPVEYTSFVRRYDKNSKPIVSWSPDSQYYRKESDKGYVVTKNQFDSLFDPKVIILWQGLLQYNARKIEAKFQEYYHKKWAPGKRLWKCVDYGQKFGDILGWDQKWKENDGKKHTVALVYSPIIPSFVASGDLIITCRYK